MKTLILPGKLEYLLSFDFDGTLTMPDHNPPVHPGFFELIESMRQTHGIFWGINTGRSLMQMVRGLTDGGFPFLPDFIIAREREVYTPNEFGRWVGVAKWNAQCEKAHRKLFRKSRKWLNQMQQWVEAETEAIWGQQEGEPAGIVAQSAAEMGRIVARIDQELPAKSQLAYQRNGIYLRFSHQDYHKGSALAEVARLAHLTTEQTFAIGDSHNDLDMLDPKVVAMMACPANACEEVKNRVRENGGYLASQSASPGAIEALQAMLGQQQEQDFSQLHVG